MRVILLAAGRGRRFGQRTRITPKCLIPLSWDGQTLLQRYLDAFRALRLKDIVIVVGHQKEKILRACAGHARGHSIRFIENRDFKKGSVVSLFVAAHELDRDCLLMDADVFFEAAQLKPWLKKRGTSFLLDPKSQSTGEEMMVMARAGRPARISKKVDPRLRILGEAVGFFKVSKKDAPRLAAILKKMVQRGRMGVEYEEAYNLLMKKRHAGYSVIKGFWTEMDFEKDLKTIRSRL